MRPDTPISRREAMRRLGFKHQYQLANFFEITEGAVSQWSDEAPLPPLRILQLKNRRPDLFGDMSAAP